MARKLILGQPTSGSVDIDTFTSQASALYAVGNTLLPDPHRSWRTSSASSPQSLTIQLTASTLPTINVVGFMYTNQDTAGAVGSEPSLKVYAATTKAGLSTPAYSDTFTASTALFRYGTHNHYLAYVNPGQQYEWWKIEIDGTIGGGYFETGIVVLSEAIEFSDDPDYGSIEIGYMSEQSWGRSSSGRIEARDRGRQAYIDFTTFLASTGSVSTDAEVLAHDEAVGHSFPVVCWAPSGADSFPVFGYQETMGPVQYLGPSRQAKSWRVVESA